MQILSGLPQEYSDVVTIMTAKKPLPSFLELRSFLLAHESRIQQFFNPPATETSQALIVMRGRGNRGGHGQFNRGGCGRFGRGQQQ